MHQCTSNSVGLVYSSYRQGAHQGVPMSCTNAQLIVWAWCAGTAHSTTTQVNDTGGIWHLLVWVPKRAWHAKSVGAHARMTCVAAVFLKMSIKERPPVRVSAPGSSPLAFRPSGRARVPPVRTYFPFRFCPTRVSSVPLPLLWPSARTNFSTHIVL